MARIQMMIGVIIGQWFVTMHGLGEIRKIMMLNSYVPLNNPILLDKG
jgi:hypothetical protein